MIKKYIYDIYFLYDINNLNVKTNIYIYDIFDMYEKYIYLYDIYIYIVFYDIW